MSRRVPGHADPVLSPAPAPESTAVRASSPASAAAPDPGQAPAPAPAPGERDPLAAAVALSWSGEPGRVERLTHGQLIDQSARAAVTLTRLGVRPGDRVAVHLPLIPESVIVTLACARIDADRTTLPVPTPAAELTARLRESGANVLITADAGFWDGAIRPVKAVADRALAAGGSAIRTVLVVSRCARPVRWHPDRDRWWHDALAA